MKLKLIHLNALRLVTVHLITLAGGHGIVPIVMSQVFVLQGDIDGAMEWLLLVLSYFVIQVAILLTYFLKQIDHLKLLLVLEGVGALGVAACIVYLALKWNFIALVPLLTAIPYMIVSFLYVRRLQRSEVVNG
jgi:hypothetical protein